nr:hypothetical protein [uncultured bacterium]
MSLEASGQNTDIAFNFFVTAEHLPDWLNQRPLVKNNCILRVVSHIANGAKHFNLEDKRHKSVKSTEKFRVYEEGVYEPNVFYEPPLIPFTDDESKELNTKEIDAVELGKRVLEFWKPY